MSKNFWLNQVKIKDKYSSTIDKSSKSQNSSEKLGKGKKTHKILNESEKTTV
jgi:hypothetical protein